MWVCAGADPIMTEPELVQIGDYAAIDNASLIAHINSRGQVRSIRYSSLPFSIRKRQHTSAYVSIHTLSSHASTFVDRFLAA